MTDFLSPIAGLLPLVIAQMAAPGQGDKSLAVWWLLGLAATAVIFNQIATAWKTITNRFKERESLDPRLVHESDCVRRHDADKKERTELAKLLIEKDTTLARELNERDVASDKKFEGLRLEIKKDVAGVHDKINACAILIGEVRGELKGIINE